MRRFRFPLAGLERLLAHREDEAKLRASQAAAAQQQAADLLGRIEGLADAARHEQRQRRVDRALLPQEELAYEAYFGKMAARAAGQRDQLAHAAQAHEDRRRELREVATRHRALGILRERRLAEHRREGLRELTRILDEAGARQAAGRRQSGGGPFADADGQATRPQCHFRWGRAAGRPEPDGPTPAA